MRFPPNAMSCIAATCGAWLVAACANPAVVSRNDAQAIDDADAGAPTAAELGEPDVGQELVCDEAVARVAPATTQRLTGRELANVLRDVLGVDVAETALAVPDGPPTDRELDNAAVGATREHIDHFATLAGEVATQVDLDALRDEYAPGCDALDDACTTRFIEGLGERLFRAPVNETELDALGAVVTMARELELSWPQAMRHVVRALVQSPRFLYRVEREPRSDDERGGDDVIDDARSDDNAADARSDDNAAAGSDVSDYELASRLSFAIWGSAPDAELLDAAQSGDLSDPDVVRAHAERMLADPRAVEHAVTFLDDWFDLHRTRATPELLELYPDFDGELLPLMRDETHALFREIARDGHPITRLHDWPRTTAHERLAAYYGLPDPQPGTSTYDLRDVPERGGLLTHGAMGSVGGPQGSMVQRGLFVLEQVLCGAIPEPPAAAAAAAMMPETAATPREGSEQRLDDPTCNACHAQFEPIVWGLARFDAVGGYAASGHAGAASPEDGWIVVPGSAERIEYDGVAELTRFLATSPRVQDCVLLAMHQYVVRRSTLRADGCWLAAARDEAGTSASYAQLLGALVTQPAFRKIRAEEATP